MNAQEEWLDRYHKLTQLRSKRSKQVMRGNMRRFRREAALERQIAAQQRCIDELESEMQRIYQNERDAV